MSNLSIPRRALRKTRHLMGLARKHLQSEASSQSEQESAAEEERLAPTDHPAFSIDLESPLVTVVIPCFNNADYVAETIRSVRQQTLQNFECLVVDDASVDSSLAVIEEAIADDSRFTVIRHGANAGLSAARNSGLYAAKAPTVTFLDSDDLLMPDSLLDRYTALEHHWSDPYVVGSFSGVSYDGEEVQLDDLPIHKRWSDSSPDKRLVDFVTAQAECPFPAHAPLLKTQAVTSLGGFEEDMRTGAEDWELWLRLMRQGYLFTPARYRTIVYRQRRDSMVRQIASSHARTAIALIDTAYQDYEIPLSTFPTDAPFTKGLTYYEAAFTKARRLIRFASIEFWMGDKEAAKALLLEIPSLPPAVLSRHVDIHSEFVRGAKRGAGVAGRDVSSINDEIESFWSRFSVLLDEAQSSGR